MAVMFSDAGPDFRWVGNERGIAGDPCWATLNPGDGTPGSTKANLNQGERPGTHWMPAECDVSIRPGWFYHANEDGKVKTPAQLLDIYYKSVGRGACLNLNLPPDRRGRIHENDVASLREFRRILDATFAMNLAQGAKLTASNTRGGDDAKFAAQNLLDGDRDTLLGHRRRRHHARAGARLRRAGDLQRGRVCASICRWASASRRSRWTSGRTAQWVGVRQRHQHWQPPAGPHRAGHHGQGPAADHPGAGLPGAERVRALPRAVTRPRRPCP